MSANTTSFLNKIFGWLTKYSKSKTAKPSTMAMPITQPTKRVTRFNYDTHIPQNQTRTVYDRKDFKRVK